MSMLVARTGLAACGFVILVTLVLHASSSEAAETSGLAAERLRCEYKENPLGIDAIPPRLSWVPASEQKGARQTAYQILVASSAGVLAQGKGDLWDSGKVASDESVLIDYAGKALTSGQTCFWKVRVWDAAGQPSPWSETASWSIGLLKKEDWQGSYIGFDHKAGNSTHPWLRKCFDLSEVPAKAYAYVNALGFYELYVNGQKVDDHVLSPGDSQFSKRSFYLTHDVTPYLKKGANCIALWLGRGWYAETLPGVVYKGPLVRAQLNMTATDGTVKSLATDDSWKAHPSPYQGADTWRPHRFGGGRYDAREENADWCRAAFNDASWINATVVEVPSHTVSAQPFEPNRLQRRLEPRNVRFLGDGQWLLDFQTNLTGFFTMTFDGLAPGQEVLLEYADRVVGETMDIFRQNDVYIAKGEDGERFSTRFNYHAFRYVKVSGLKEMPGLQDAEAYLIHTDYPIYSAFSCSDTMLTRIHDMVFYTLRCLSLGGHLVDCPHIERLGYGGDGQASTPTAMTMFGLGPMYTGWLGHWRDCQRPDGGMPHTAPNPYMAGGGPYWCGFNIAASWEMFKLYGDRRVLEVNYPSMQKWLDGYAESYCVDDILRPWPNTDYRNWYLGDWALPGRTEKEQVLSRDLVNNCFRIQCFDWMARIAAELGKKEDAARYQAKAKALRPLVHATFYDEARGTYADDQQLDMAYPLLVGVTPEALRGPIMKRLEETILVKKKGHLDVGLVGVPLLVEELMRADRNDLVRTFTAKDTFPGWGFMLEQGATTTWEHWDGARSHIHNCYNGIGIWFYRGLAGILPDAAAPAFKHFTLRPGVGSGLAYAKARQDTVRGVIESAWRIDEKEKTFHWDIRVPANTNATVMVPATQADKVTEGGKPANSAEGLRFVKFENGHAVYEAQAGRYSFAAPMQ